MLLIFSVVVFCFGVKCEAEELDPIAAQHLLTTKDTIIVPLEKLRLTEKINPEFFEQAMYFMNLRIADKNYPKRAPLDVIERGDYSQITDMWAASLIYPDEESLLAAFEKIKKRDEVIWINDHWNNPLPQGYRDIHLCLILSNGAIVELQMHHQAIWEISHTIDHKIYEFVRSNMKKPNMQDCVQRARNCQKILYASVWNGKFAEIDAETKKALDEITLKLSRQTSPKKAALVLDELEKLLNDNLVEELLHNAAQIWDFADESQKLRILQDLIKNNFN